MKIENTAQHTQVINPRKDPTATTGRQSDLEEQQLLINIAESCLAFLRIPPDLESKKAFILKAVERNGAIYPFLTDQLQKDPDVIKHALWSPQTGAPFISPLDVSERESALLLVKHIPTKFAKLPTRFQSDKEIVMYAIFQDPRLLDFASDILKEDEDIAIVAGGINEAITIVMGEKDKQSFLMELHNIFPPFANEVAKALKGRKIQQIKPELKFHFE